jgi:hypothetical protein
LLRQRIGVVHEIDIAFEFRMRFKRLALGKGFDSGIAVGAEQDANGHLQFLVKFVGERQGQR